MSKEKYSQLFQFLKGYYQLRESTVRDIKTSRRYHNYWSLERIRNYRDSHSPFLQHSSSTDVSTVLIIPRPQKPEEPEKPDVLEEWRPWIDGDPFVFEPLPSIKEIIETENEIISLEDDSDLEESVMGFFEDLGVWRELQAKYLEDLEQYNYEKSIYDPFFSASNKKESFPERYELLLGLGVFSKQDKLPIRKPLVTVPLDIKVLNNGSIKVSLSLEGQLFRVETDFLSGIEEFNLPQATTKLEAGLAGEENDFWEIINNLGGEYLEAFAYALSTDCVYRDSNEFPETIPDEPTIHLSPVFIFRERSLRSFTALFEGILEYLEKQDDSFQLGLLDRVVFPLEDLPEGDLEASGMNWNISADEVLLPKVSNAEQRKIAERIGKKNIVLVQGPPGTGKSHTIANVVAYLLSRGKKVLVTAQTDQALQALRSHIPENFLELVVYFLETRQQKTNELDKSIRALQDAINRYDPGITNRLISKKKETLQRLHEEKAELLNDIKTLQQSDRRETFLNDQYHGDTLLNLTEKVTEEGRHFDWFKDKVENVPAALGLLEKLQEWLELIIEVQRSDFSPEKAILPDTSFLLSSEELKELLELEEKQEEYSKGDIPAPTSPVSTKELNNLYDDLIYFWEQLPWGLAWFEELQGDIEAYVQSEKWNRILSNSKKVLVEISKSALDDLSRNYIISVPSQVLPLQLLGDVKKVIEYVKEGGKLTGILKSFTLPKVVKERAYIYKECSINNYPPVLESELKILENYARVLSAISELDRIWGGYKVKHSDLREKVLLYKEKINQLGQVLHDYSAFLDVRKTLQNTFSLQSDWLRDKQDFYELNEAIQAFKVEVRLKELDRKRTNSLDYLEQLNSREFVTIGLKRGLLEKSLHSYLTFFKDLLELIEVNSKFNKALALAEELYPVFKDTMMFLQETGTRPEIDQDNLMKAVYWSNARLELERRFSETLDDKYASLQLKERDIQDTASKYLKTKAIEGFMKNLSSREELNKQLTRWGQAMQQARGSGKLAFKYRLNAQKILKRISKEIPCWIIPMYRLVDTLSPGPEVFDVVIVDEASQLGPEALLLKYYTKKVIVVGDDQQTAPENVGVRIDEVENLIKTHLNGIPDRDFFNTKHSFFDHIDAMSGGRITLREHFRCMPEIIEFSNQLCYRDQGIELVPLKQYSANRLPPLGTYYLNNGTFHNDVNIPEAKAIVDKVQEILSDEEYHGKTIGIIALQGNKQSVEIDRQLREKISHSDYIERRIVCGTPPDFQGDERDIILLSLVTALDHKRTSLTKDNYRRRFNVAMSRAKEQVLLFHSVQLFDIKNEKDLRYKLLNFFETSRIENPDPEEIPISSDRSQSPPRPFDSWFEVDVYKDIQAKTYLVQPQYKVGPYRIDLVVHLPNGKKVAIECDGDKYHEGEALNHDVERQLILERAGWEFFRVRWSHYKYAPEESLEKLWVLLEERGKTGSSKLADPPKNNSNGNEKPGKDKEYQEKPSNPQETSEGSNNLQLGLFHSPASEFSENEMIDLLIFTNRARMYKQRMPFSGWKDFGTHPKLSPEENEIFRCPTRAYEGFMVFGYSNGKVDKVSLSAFRSSRECIKNAYHKKQKLLFIKRFLKDEDIVGITKEKKVILFNTSLVSKHSSRGNQGNQVFKTGSEVKKYKLARKAKLDRPEFYRKTSLGARGYYLKPGDKV
jgi:very-short-patch-repair endonuclease